MIPPRTSDCSSRGIRTSHLITDLSSGLFCYSLDLLGWLGVSKPAMLCEPCQQIFRRPTIPENVEWQEHGKTLYDFWVEEDCILCNSLKNQVAQDAGPEWKEYDSWIKSLTDELNEQPTMYKIQRSGSDWPAKEGRYFLFMMFCPHITDRHLFRERMFDLQSITGESCFLRNTRMVCMSLF